MDGATGSVPSSLEFGCYRFHPDRRSVSHDGKQARLQPMEYRLALLLFSQAGTPMTRDAIFESVWDKGRRKPSHRTIDVHIAGLRRKLAMSEHSAASIRCIHGFGYVLFMKKMIES